MNVKKAIRYPINQTIAHRVFSCFFLLLTLIYSFQFHLHRLVHPHFSAHPVLEVISANVPIDASLHAFGGQPDKCYLDSFAFDQAYSVDTVFVPDPVAFKEFYPIYSLSISERQSEFYRSRAPPQVS